MTEKYTEPVTDEQVSAYYRESFQAIKNGETRFVVRNFDADFGRVEDLYSYNGKVACLGYVHTEYDWGSTAYKMVENRPHPLNKEPLQVQEARELLLGEIG